MKKGQILKTAFSEYKIINQLGQGGAGFVYSVKNEDGEKVAVKILNPTQITRERLKRFENEFRFCAQNIHPNIIKVQDHGISEKETPFFVMPEFESSLRPLMGKIENPSALKLFGAILDGIEAAHLKGVVHRDLKPENILVNLSTNQLVITDFGIASFSSEDIYTAVETKNESRL